MISDIPKGQICEAFDPVMNRKEKTVGIISDHMKANTSCVAPASVYMEGSRGKRFLCDYHFHYEKDMTMVRTPEQWPDIARFLIDKREDLKNSFPEPESNDRHNFGPCWCGKRDTYVMLKSKNGSEDKFFCTFHYHKLLYRYLSNNVEMARDYAVVDERKHMTITLEEEANSLSVI
jgi:hypothetical protein